MISLEVLQIFIYCMFFFSLISYATLDGFDLGVGILHLFAKSDQERRVMINAIGPVWDGNTTWIVVSSGILFAGFPKVFANLASNLYLPTMALLFGFMLRGAAIEFRSKGKSIAWRSFWDYAFFFASLILAVMTGLVLGNLIQGLPLDHQGEYLGSSFALATFYPILVSLFGIVTFAMHGSLYMVMKTEDALHDKMRRFAKRLIALFLFFWFLTTGVTLFFYSHMAHPFLKYPFLSVLPFLSLCSIGGILYSIKKNWDGRAFTFSCFSIVFLLVLVVIGLFPNIVLSTTSPETNSLTLYNSSSSKISLMVMSIISIIGIPLGFFYGSYIYKVFKGKVKIDPMSY